MLTPAQFNVLYKALIHGNTKVSSFIDMRVKTALLDKGYISFTGRMMYNITAAGYQAVLMYINKHPDKARNDAIEIIQRVWNNI